MKFKIILVSLLIGVALSTHTLNANKSPSPSALVNQYKDLKNPFGVHSLFTGHNAENISNDFRGVPPPIAEKTPPPQFEEPERQVAKRLVKLYRKQFDFLDSINVNDIVDAQELSTAFRDFAWPKAITDVTDDQEYAKTIISKYDRENKGGMNFVDFCQFAEELWDVADSLQEQKCASGFDKSMEVWDGLFKWLDRDSDGRLGMDDMIYGISKIMYRDVNMEEIQKVFIEYGGTEKKITYDNFVLAIANGMLDETFKDPNFTETFNK